MGEEEKLFWWDKDQNVVADKGENCKTRLSGESALDTLGHESCYQ